MSNCWRPTGWVPAAVAAAQIPSLDQGIAEDVVTLLALPLEERQRLAEAAHDIAPISDAAAPDHPVRAALVPRFHVV